MKFYTYAHMKADSGEIFYIGKGSGNRYKMGWSKSGHRSEFWKRTVDKHGFKPVILARWAKESDAFAHERLLIESMRGIGIQLVNLCDGGMGASGAKRSPEICELIGSRYRGKVLSDDHKKKLAAAKIGTKQSEETVAKRVAKCVGQKRSDATKRMMSELASRRTPAQIQAAAKARILAGYTEEGMRRIKAATSKPLLCNETGVTYRSGAEAMQWLISIGHKKPSMSNISANINGRKRSAYGFTWSREAALRVKTGEGI